MNNQAVNELEITANDLAKAFDDFEEQITQTLKHIKKSLKRLRRALHAHKRITNNARNPHTKKVIKKATAELEFDNSL